MLPNSTMFTRSHAHRVRGFPRRNITIILGKRRSFNILEPPDKVDVSSGLESKLESSLGGPGGLEMAETNFLGALEIPLSEKRSSCQFGCSVFALVRGFLVVLSSNKAASLP